MPVLEPLLASRSRRLVLLVATLTAFLLAAALPLLANGTGVLYTYYATSACINAVGSELIGCDADRPPTGQVTPYFTTQTVSCPSGPSGGGGGGGWPPEGDEDYE